MSAFTLYVIGFLALITGLGYGAYLLDVPQTWIGVGALIMVGLGVMSAVSHQTAGHTEGSAACPGRQCAGGRASRRAAPAALIRACVNIKGL
jgi:hypothetical protein